MTADEKLVRDSWDNVRTRHDLDHDTWDFFTNNALYAAFRGNSLQDLYKKGARFTRERLEQIRQLQEEITEIDDEAKKRHCLMHVECIRRRCRQYRTLARLQAELTELRRGMRQEGK